MRLGGVLALRSGVVIAATVAKAVLLSVALSGLKFEQKLREIAASRLTVVAAPVDAKIVPDLGRPGRNVTGSIHIAPITVQLNTILAYRPIRRLGVVYNPQERNSILTIEGLRAETASRGLDLVGEPVPPTFSVTELIVCPDKAMLALASSAYGIGRFTAFKAAQILINGTDPADIPIETLKRFSVIINMTTARTLEYYPLIGPLNFAEIIES